MADECANRVRNSPATWTWYVLVSDSGGCRSSRRPLQECATSAASGISPPSRGAADKLECDIFHEFRTLIADLTYIFQRPSFAFHARLASCPHDVAVPCIRKHSSVLAKRLAGKNVSEMTYFVSSGT